MCGLLAFGLFCERQLRHGPAASWGDLAANQDEIQRTVVSGNAKVLPEMPWPAGVLVSWQGLRLRAAST